MTITLYFAIYAGALLFVVGCICRIVQYARTPVHLRWELYPVPHEEPERAAHGGSYFETTNWWQRPAHFSIAGELRAMLPEMVFLKGLWEFNRRLWYASFVFHLGLYCSILSAALVLASALFANANPASSNAWAVAVQEAYRVIGYAAAFLTIAGAALLLHRRIVDPDLKNFTAPADIFHLLLFLFTYGLLVSGYILAPAGFSVRACVIGLSRLDAHVPLGGLFGAGVLMACALAAYIPFTHMAHFIAKYFTYHAVRWDDRRNVRGGALETRLNGYLLYKPTWSAAHIGATGEKTWADIATTNPAQEVRK